jgi:hypothetical protein
MLHRPDHTSRLNRTPPMGAPKATEMPAAAAADNTSRFLAIKLSARVNINGHMPRSYLHYHLKHQMVS